MPTLESVEQVTPAARDGSIKACIIASHAVAPSSTIVVAFRGTASLVDWLVNIDGDLEDAASFVNHDVNSSSSTGSPAVADILITAHAGLLRVAKAMATAVCDKVLNSLTVVSQPAELPILLLTLPAAVLQDSSPHISGHSEQTFRGILVQCIA